MSLISVGRPASACAVGVVMLVKVSSLDKDPPTGGVSFAGALSSSWLYYCIVSMAVGGGEASLCALWEL
jgi:hypothetical protein